MLRHATPHIVLDKLGRQTPMPKNKSQQIRWRRPRTFGAVKAPLQEGVTPNATQFRYDDVSAILKQYGMVAEITDVIEDTHEDPVLNDMAAAAGENIGRTIEALTFGVLIAGTSVFYANGAARNAVNTAITLNKIRAVVKFLKAQKAEPVNRILDSSVRFATRWVEAGYVAVCHTDLEPDIRNLAGFQPVAAYGTRSTVHEMELGTVESVRFILSADFSKWADAGGLINGMVSTSGVNADVYPVLFFGRDAFGTVALRGEGAVNPTIIPPGQRTKDDPLGQRGYVGWKTWHTTAILNQLWMARLEVSATNI
jgi:N4-gp56 family major capsid protein